MKKVLKKYSQLSIEIKAGLWFAICNFINKGISMIVIPIYTRILSTEEYGNYAVFQSWLNIFVIIATLEISRGHYKLGIIKYEEDVKRYTSSMLGLGSAFTFFILLIYMLFKSSFDALIGLSTPIMLCMFAYLIVYPAWEFWTIDQRFAYKYKRMVIITVIIAVLTPAIGIFSILALKLESEAAILSKLAVQGFAAVILYIMYVQRGKILYKSSYWKEVFIYNITLIPYLLSTIVLNQADRIMINNMVGAAQAAIYSVAYSVAVIFQLFNTAISDAFVPWMYRRLKENQYEKIEPINDRLLLLVSALNLLLVLFAPEIIHIFAPPQYHDAIWIIPPVTASVFFVFLFTRYINVELFYEATSQISIISIGIALLNILLNYYYISKVGYLAAGYTTLFCYILFCLAHFFTLKRICAQKCEGKQIFTGKHTLGIAVIFLSLVFLIMSVYRYSYIRYGIAIILCFCFYIKRDFILWILKSKKAD